MGTFTVLCKGDLDEQDEPEQAFLELIKSDSTRYIAVLADLQAGRMDGTDGKGVFYINEELVDKVIAEVARPGSLLRSFIIEFDTLRGYPKAPHWTILCNAAKEAGKILV